MLEEEVKREHFMVSVLVATNMSLQVSDFYFNSCLLLLSHLHLHQVVKTSLYWQLIDAQSWLFWTRCEDFSKIISETQQKFLDMWMTFSILKSPWVTLGHKLRFKIEDERHHMRVWLFDSICCTSSAPYFVFSWKLPSNGITDNRNESVTNLKPLTCSLTLGLSPLHFMLNKPYKDSKPTLSFPLKIIWHRSHLLRSTKPLVTHKLFIYIKKKIYSRDTDAF